MNENYAIGIDFGTLSARAVLLNLGNGEVASTSEFKYPHGVMDQRLPNGTELEADMALQHPQDYLDALSFVVRDIIRLSNVDCNDIVGVGIDFTSSTVLPVDKKGIPLCFNPKYENDPHAYVKLWKHHSAEPEAAIFTKAALECGEEWLSDYGGKVSSEWFFPKILETLHKSPELYQETSRFVEAGDWIVWMLTGSETHSSCMAGYKCMWDKKRGYPSNDFFCKVDPLLNHVIGTKVSEHVQPTGTKAGEVNSYGSQLTGLHEGTVVSVPIIDAHASVPASGVTEPGKLMLIIGTSSVHIVMDENKKKINGICGAVTDGIIPDLVAYEAGQTCVGDMFDWFVQKCVPGSYCEEAQSLGISVFELLQNKAAERNEEKSKLLALDWWNGNRTPFADYDLSGVICGLTLSTKPEEIYRALMEATAFGTRAIVELYENSGIEIKEIVASGGISQKNTVMMQIYADILNKPITVPLCQQSGAIGSALLASCAAEYFSCVKDTAVITNTMETKTYKPNKDRKPMYDSLYALYQTLSDLFGKKNRDFMDQLKQIQ